MSRELRFRAWDKKRKCYAKVIQTTNQGWKGYRDKTYITNGVMCFSKWVLSRFIIEQYTGLKDKNGKMIYEGDIVKQLMYVLDGKECITTWVVRWNNDEFCYDLHRVAGALYGDSMLSTCESKDCEIIGNVHENKELLGGKNE